MAEHFGLIWTWWWWFWCSNLHCLVVDREILQNRHLRLFLQVYLWYHRSHPTPPTSLIYPRLSRPLLCLSCYGPLCIWKMFRSIRLDIKPFSHFIFFLPQRCCDASSFTDVLMVSITATDSTELCNLFICPISKSKARFYTVWSFYDVWITEQVFVIVKTIRLGWIDVTKPWHGLNLKGSEMYISF